MVTGWPRMPGLQTSAERLAQSITAMSDGRLKVVVYPADTLVRSFRDVRCVSAPVSPTCTIRPTSISDKSPALHFFSAVPYGLTADELYSWIAFGGGQELWDEVDAHSTSSPYRPEYRRADGRLVHQGDQPPGRL